MSPSPRRGYSHRVPIQMTQMKAKTYWLWVNEDERRAVIVDDDHQEEFRNELYKKGYLPEYSLEAFTPKEGVDRAAAIAIRDYDVLNRRIKTRGIPLCTSCNKVADELLEKDDELLCKRCRRNPKCGYCGKRKQRRVTLVPGSNKRICGLCDRKVYS